MSKAGARNGLSQIASGYVRLSHCFFYALAVLGLIMAATGAYAQSQGQLDLSPNISVNAVQPFGCGHPLFPSSGYYQASGSVTASGTYVGNVYLTGSVTITGHDELTGNQEIQKITLTQGDFNPDPLNFPGQSQSSASNAPRANSNFCQPVLDAYSYWVAASTQPGCTSNACLLTNSTVGVSISGSENFYILVDELPLFQVPQLGISANSSDFSGIFQAFDQLPIGDYYMFTAQVALVFLTVAIVISAITYLMGSSGGPGGNRVGWLSLINNIFVTLVLIFLLPFVYNTVAGFANVLNQQLIAGPGTPYTSYSNSVGLINDHLHFGGNLLTDAIGWIAGVMVWIIMNILGVARLFLIGAMIVAMPLVLVLRDIRFTSRFAGTIEDTFFGLIFASVISALFIGVAAVILQNYGGTIFSRAGVDSNWVALAALLGAILAPTIFAPMTGVFFQTMSQVGMAAAGTAILMGGAAGPQVLTGLTGGVSAAGQALSAPGVAGSGAVKKAGAAVGAFGGSFARVVPAMAHNMAVMGTVGTMGGLGASRAASSLNRVIDFKTPTQSAQAIMAHRGGMLAIELGLGGGTGWKDLVGGAVGSGVGAETIRGLHGLESDPAQFRTNLNDAIAYHKQGMSDADIMGTFKGAINDVTTHGRWMDGLINTGKDFRLQTYNGISNSSGARGFRYTRWVDPVNPTWINLGQKVEAKAFKERVLRAASNPDSLRQFYASHHIGTPQQWNNEQFMKREANQLHEKVSKLDTEKVSDVGALQNLKNYADSTQFRNS